MISAAKIVRTPGCSLPSLCALNCAVRSLRWPWNLCENRVLRSAQALRHCRLCCSRMYWCWGKSLLRCLASAVVARRRFVCSVRKKKRSQCQHRCRRRHAPSHSYVSPGQVRPRPQPTMSQPVFSLSPWKNLESLVAQHRLAAVRRCRRRHPSFRPANASLAQQHAAQHRAKRTVETNARAPIACRARGYS